jgi:hypothetical protein
MNIVRTRPQAIGSVLRLRGGDVRFRGVLEAFGFWPISIQNPTAPTEVVMQRHLHDRSFPLIRNDPRLPYLTPN